MSELFRQEKLYWVILGIFFISCTSDPEIKLPPEISSLPNLNVIYSNTNPSYELQIELDLTISQLDEMHIQGLWDVHTDIEGNFYWQDNTISKIHKYSLDGDYIRSFGGKGKGPGEFESFNSSTVYSNSLTGLDYFTQRIQTFDIHTGDLTSTAILEFDESISLFSQTAQIFQESDSTIIGIANHSISFKGDSLSISRYALNGELKK
ncbi:MAG: 6-bladed beta-propeller [Candidatus Paceibacterota bacterium]